MVQAPAECSGPGPFVDGSRDCLASGRAISFSSLIGEQRVQLGPVPFGPFLRAAFCACIALAPAACAQTVANTAATQAADENAPKSEEDLKTQCWMAQEKTKNVNNIDAKIAAVDKCVAEGKKHLPPAG
ncbi:MAG TPA: hypothetical protein VHD34_00010 [Xanthobacteraceae bacterium]|nr:hypothetical protein [Xanthobacteraceae bacterium]